MVSDFSSEKKPSANSATSTTVSESEPRPSLQMNGPGRIVTDEEETADEGIKRCMEKASKSLEKLQPGQLELVKTLQEAVRNHGRVDLIKEIKTGKFMAVKRMPTSWVRGSQDEFLKAHPNSSELPWFDVGLVNYLESRGFPYLCESKGMFKDESHTYVAANFASGGDLFAWCDRGPTLGPEREAEMRPMVRQSLSATCWLHELGIGHRDLSLENILLTTDERGSNVVKLIDFGMATTKRRCVNENRGKQSYQAPEMHIGKMSYDCFYQDCFSLGVTIFGMAAADYPWYATRNGKCQLWDFYCQRGLQAFLERRKARKGNLKLVEVFSPSLIDLLVGMVEILPEDRLTLGESVFDVELGDKHKSVWDNDWLHEFN